MKKMILPLFVLAFVGISSVAQTAETNASSGYVQNYPTTTKSDTKLSGTNYYMFRGQKYYGISGQITWVGNTAVMNSDDGSFQVCFREIPKKSKTYKIIDHLNDDGVGDVGLVSISLMANNSSDFFWSIDNAPGKVKVKVGGGKIKIEVTGVKLCIYETSTCETVSGQITLGMY